MQKFKDFFKNPKIQSMIKGTMTENPFRVMIDRDPEKFNYFLDDFKKTLVHVIGNNHPTMVEKIKEYLKIN